MSFFPIVIDLFCKLEGNVIAYALLETPPGVMRVSIPMTVE